MDLKDLADVPYKALTVAMLYKLLGPSAAYLGGKGQEYATIAIGNIERVLKIAYTKLREDASPTGSVPPRVLRGTISEAAYCEDAIAAEYLGGVLASSRGEGSRDDRGVAMNALISRLSVYQLRTHYICYHAARDLYEGTNFKFDGGMIQSGGVNGGIRVPFLNYAISMGFVDHEMRWKEPPQNWFESILEHTLHGLQKEGLIASFDTFTEDMHLHPSRLGIELFMWAHGCGPLGTNAYLDPKLKFEPHPDIPLIRERSQMTVLGTGEVAGWIEPYCYATAEGMRCQIPGTSSPVAESGG